MNGASLLEQVFAAAAEAGQRPPLTDNVDPERFPAGMEALTAARSQQRMDHLTAHAARWEWLAAGLGDTSRALLTALLTFHLLGHRRARVGPSSVELRALLNQAYERLVIERDVTPIAYAGSPATHRFDLAPIGYDITLESYMLGVQGTFQLQQYRSRTHPEARARTGDVAIDAGACFGETALWLAHTVGPTGRVHTLEFAPANLTILKANLERNPRLADRIVLTETALWETRRAPSRWTVADRPPW